MDRQGTPQLAGTLPRETSPRGSGNGCKVDEMGGEDVQAARAAFRFVASDAFEFNLIGDVTDDKSKGPADKTLDINETAHRAAHAASTSMFAGPRYGVAFDRPLHHERPVHELRELRGSDQRPGDAQHQPRVHWGVSGTADWNITDNLSLKLILAHRKFDAEFGRDSDGSPLPINHTFDRFVHEQDSCELRFNGQAFGTRTDWTVGGFKFDANDFQPNFVILYPEPTLPFPQRSSTASTTRTPTTGRCSCTPSIT